MTAGPAVPAGGPWSATHLFNRMPALGHRTPGPIPVLLQAARQSPDRMVLELIADGVHLDPEIVRMVFDLVGPDSIALITDAMAAAGMSDGHYTLGSLDVLVQDRVARLVPDGHDAHPGAIAGATSLLLENVRRCVDWGIPLADAVTAASATPARLMGLDRAGDPTSRVPTRGRWCWPRDTAPTCWSPPKNLNCCRPTGPAHH